MLLGLALGAASAALVALPGTAPEAEATTSQKVVFVSDRTEGVDNSTGDTEIFKMNPNGTGVRQLTFNDVDDAEPVLSPDARNVAYMSRGDRTSNPQGDYDVYRVNASDGSGKRNLSNNGVDVRDFFPDFSPDGKTIAYTSEGPQASKPEGDDEVYRMKALDGTGKKNLSNNKASDYSPDWGVQGT